MQDADYTAGQRTDDDAAGSVGCCRASSKETCRRPPCPCNLEAWTPSEREQIRRDAVVVARKQAA